MGFYYEQNAFEIGVGLESSQNDEEKQLIILSPKQTKTCIKMLYFLVSLFTTAVFIAMSHKKTV